MTGLCPNTTEIAFSGSKTDFSRNASLIRLADLKRWQYAGQFTLGRCY